MVLGDRRDRGCGCPGGRTSRRTDDRERRHHPRTMRRWRESQAHVQPVDCRIIQRHAARRRRRRNQDAARTLRADRRSGPSPIEVGEFVDARLRRARADDPRVPQGARSVEARGDRPRRCFGVAGAVTDQVARLTNVPWLVDGDAIARRGARLDARAHPQRPRGARLRASPVLEPDELAVLQQGVASRRRQRRGDRGRHRARRSAAAQRRRPVRAGRRPKAGTRTSPRARRARSRCCATLTRIYGRCSVEHVISRAGPGQHLPVHARRVRQPDRPSRRTLAPARRARRSAR